MKAILGYLAISLLVFWLSGCASTQPLPERVLVPVPVECPAPQLPARPALPISDLNAGASPSAVAKAYAVTVEVLIGYAKQLEALLTPNSQPSTPDSSR